MKEHYFRATTPRRPALIAIAILSIGALALVEKLPATERQPAYEQKLAAARLALEAFAVVKAERLARGIPIDERADPQASGLIGRAFSPVTSNSGSIAAKRASIDPNFAALLVEWLTRAKVGKGDLVALGVSGSFPALSIATYAAVRVLELEAIIVTSASASEWGANEPAFMWLDMEKTLFDKGLFAFRSRRASRGGVDDYGFGLSPEGIELIDAAIARNGIERMDARSVEEGIEFRMRFYEDAAGARPIKAYVNIGGGTASVGTHIGKKQFDPGLGFVPPSGAVVDSVMLRFARRGVPVIHLTAVEELAEKHGFLRDGSGSPRVGTGTIFDRDEYNPWIAIGGLIAILGSMLAFLRLGARAHSIAGSADRKDRASLPPVQTI